MSSGGGKKCSYVNCLNTSKNSDVSFFSFPTKNRERCNEWIVNCGRDEFSELPDTKLRNKVLCAVHFKSNAFCNETRKRLLQNNHPYVIPFPWFEVSDIEQSQIVFSPTTEFVTPKDKGTRICSNGETVPGNLSELELNEKFAQDNVIKQAQEETIEQFNADFNPLPNTPVVPSDMHKNESPTPRKKKLLGIVSRQRLVLKRNRSTLSYIRKASPKNLKLKELLDSISKYISGDTLTFVLMQLRHQKQSPWTEEEKNLALSIYYKSPSIYRFLRDRGFKLPCSTLIRKWINVYNVTPGFSNEMLTKLKKKVSTMTSDEKPCILMFDEMSIKKALEYEPSSDLVEGFEDLGPLGRTDNIATHALLFMLRGLHSQWKCPIAYFLSKNSIKATSLSLIIDMCLENIIKTGLSVRVIVCDQGSTNVAAMRLLGVSEGKPYIYYENKKIHFMFDVPHLFKSIRNNLINHDMEINGKLVSWKDLKNFYDVEKLSSNGCRAAPKLSERHINPQNFQKMSVKLATQVFSASVSRGMQAASTLGSLKSSSASDTAIFFGKLNDIFDCLNSKYCYDSNPLRRPLSESNPNVAQCLNNALRYISSWKLKNKHSNPLCFAGLAISIQSVLSLYEDLRSQDKDRYILTGRLNQDPIENTFGVLRQRGGYNSNPSARQFRRNLQHVISIRLMNPPGSANCEPDCDLNLDATHPQSQCGEHDPMTPTQELSEHPIGIFTSEKELEIADAEPSSTSNNTVMPTYEGNPSLQDNVISYVAGWLVKKLEEKYNCEECKKVLISENCLENPKEHILIHLKAFTCHTGEFAKLHVPSNLFCSVVHWQVHCFTELFKQFASEKGVHNNICRSTVLETEKKYEGWFTSDCKDHRMFLLSTLIRCKLFYEVKWKSHDFRDRALLNISKKRRNNQNKSDLKVNKKLRKVSHT